MEARLRGLKALLVWVLSASLAFAQTYPSPRYQNVTVNALTLNQLILGGDTTGPLTPLGSLGTTTTLLHGNAAGVPSFAAVDLVNDVGASRLPYAHLVQGTTNTVPANVTAGTADFAAFAMPSCSAAANALQWTTNTGFTCSSALSIVFPETVSGTVTSGGIPYFNSTTQMSSSALLAANQIILGGGAGVAPATLGSLGTTTTLLHGNAAGAPTFGVVALADHATQAANTVLANATAGVATPTAFAMPSCDTATKALQWTTSTGFACNSAVGSVTSVAQSFTGGLISVGGSPITTSGTLALTVAGTSGGIPYFSGATTWASSAALAANALVIGGGAGVAPSTTTTGAGVVTAVASATTGTGGLVSTTSPTITTPNIVGVTDASNATAGSVGEYISSEVLIASEVTLTTATAANVTSVSLTAGDWDCQGEVVYDTNAATTVTNQLGWISTTSASLPTFPNKGGASDIAFSPAQTGFVAAYTIGRFRVNVNATTTTYLSAYSIFGVNTEKVYGFIGCRRMR